MAHRVKRVSVGHYSSRAPIDAGVVDHLVKRYAESYDVETQLGSKPRYERTSGIHRVLDPEVARAFHLRTGNFRVTVEATGPANFKLGFYQDGGELREVWVVTPAAGAGSKIIEVIDRFLEQAGLFVRVQEFWGDIEALAGARV